EQIWNVWVDVFPLDSMPKNKTHFTIRKYHILYRRMMFLFSCFDDMVSVNKKNRPFIEKAMIKLGSTIHPDRFLSTPKQIRKFNQCLRRYRFSRGYYIINLMGIYKFRSLMERPIYGKKTEIPFEGVNFRVPEQYELYLEKIYGDYMALPPEEQRNHHEIELITED
ncbi:MAG: LicD family protein, partial [Lachnospiraceae bacterium]|nr:LicD family protein [Lachnospiraceae bacterium]